MNFHSQSGTLLATGHVRIVHGGRGDYVEFTWDQIHWPSFIIPQDQAYRFRKDWAKKVFYREYRSNDASWVKLYDQLRPVSYADYKVGYLYMAPGDLVYQGELE